MSFFDMSVDDIEALEPIYFPAKTPVEMTILSVKEMPRNGTLMLTTTIDSGEHAGKQFEFGISGSESPIARKKKAAFILAMWTKEQIKAGQATLDSLVGTKFQCRPEAPYEGKQDGKTYQNFDGFLKLSAPEAVDLSKTPF